jgi:hypothetical protein
MHFRSLKTIEGLEALTPVSLTYWLAGAAVFFKTLASGDRVVKPPRWVVNDMLSAPTPNLPEERP